MAFHESYRQQFIQKAALPAPSASTTSTGGIEAPTGAVAAYQVTLQPAQVASGQLYWRLIGAHHLTPDENRGGHAVFVDIVDEAGNPVRDSSYRLRWGWEGQRADEASPPKSFDKPANEPATNVDLFLGQEVFVTVDGGGLPSDRVAHLHSKHADERGPNGELWNSIGHHSFYLVFRRTRAAAENASTPLPSTTGTKPEVPTSSQTPATQATDSPLKIIEFGAVSHLDLLNAFAQAAGQLGLENPWVLLERAGLSMNELSLNGWARYTGLPIHELPNLSVAEKNLVMEKLALVLATMPTAPLGSAPAPSTPKTQPAPVTNPSPAPTPTPSPTGPVKVNRLGFYLHVSNDQDGLWEAIRQVQPPVILFHTDTANRLLLREIRAFRAPNAFVIGRIYKESSAQRALLTSDDPGARGREMAEEILALDFGLATERGANGRLLVDGWMSLNEAVPGPASRQFAEQPAECAALLRAYDLFQSDFHARLQDAGVEALAFNFGAGNFTRPEHYRDHFPNTLATYTYLGFHEYGWPALYPAPGSATSAGLYRTCMEGLRARYGGRHRVVISEAGLTRIFQNPAAGDVGWLNREEPLSQEEYWKSLQWYNQQLAADDYVVGACLFEVGHHGNWETFRHLGRDNEGHPLQLIQQIAALNQGSRGSTQGARGSTRRPRQRSEGTARGSQPGRRGATTNFVRVQGEEFVADGRPLRFIGANIRGIVHYGDGRTLPFSTSNHAREQIQGARAMGVRVIRVFLPSIHADVQTTIGRLRDLIALVRAEAPDLYVLPALCNLYQDVEFRIPGDDGFYERLDPNFPGNLLNAAFFTGGYRQNYLPFVQAVVQAFRDETRIFAWEIGNELKLNPVSGDLESDPNVAAFLNFMLDVAREIRQLDPNHLITTGMISTHHAWLHTPALCHKLYAGPEFDFITVHCYNDERQNDDSDLARELGKPFIVEEAGYGRQFGGDRSPKSREDMAIWFGKGSRGYMPWGFMATSNDMGDGDRDSGLDRTLHGDWDQMFALFRSQAELLTRESASIVLPAPQNSTSTSAGQTLPPSTPSGGTSSDGRSTDVATIESEPVGAFRVEQNVFATDWINVRKSPGYVDKLGDDILGMVAPAGAMTITGALVVQDGLTWWPVRATLNNGPVVDGWAAETNGSIRLLSSGRARGAAPVPQPRGAGQFLYATTYVNLRRTPGYVGKGSDDLLGQIPYGAKVQELGTAVVMDALSWRPVRAPLLDNSVATGWVAEMDASGLELLALAPPPAPVSNVGGVIGSPLQPGEEVTLLAVTNMLPEASLSTKAAEAVSAFLPNTKVTIVAGPELRGDLEWWQSTESSSTAGSRVGWTALTDEAGTRLMAATRVAEQITVALPFAGSFAITQGWGGNAAVYGTILYDGVPLKGHNGIDFDTPLYTPLLACDSGVVQRVDYEDEGFGHFIVLRHAWGESLYAHLERVDVPHGANVTRGQPLGISGNSGFSTGRHLHFGIRIFPYRRTDGWGGFVNPMPFLPWDNFVAGRERSRASIDRAVARRGWVRP